MIERDIELSKNMLEGEQISLNGGFEIIAYPLTKPKLWIFDVDGTLYSFLSSAGKAYKSHTVQKEIEAIASTLYSGSNETAEWALKMRRQTLEQELDRPARLTEAVLSLGLDRNWWNCERDNRYEPEKFIKEDQRISLIFEKLLQNGNKIALATNSPKGAAHRILNCLGVKQQIMEKINVFGPENLSTSKPDHRYFKQIVEKLNTPIEECFSIGDDEQNDAHPAVELGMGAAVIQTINNIEILTEQFTNGESFKQFDLESFAKSLIRPGKVSMLCITGRAGAGKTTAAERTKESCQQQAGVIPLDAFFKLSSKERSAWINELGITEQERERRKDQSNWWDFEKAAETLKLLRQGELLHLKNIYNRADGGELTGEIKIAPDIQNGFVVIFEGVATAHIDSNLFDATIYINAHEKIRRERILERDIKRRGPEEAKKRWILTQSFEDRYFTDYKHKLRSNNKADSLMVVDNSKNDGFNLTQLPPIIPFR